MKNEIPNLCFWINYDSQLLPRYDDEKMMCSSLRLNVSVLLIWMNDYWIDCIEWMISVRIVLFLLFWKMCVLLIADFVSRLIFKKYNYIILKITFDKQHFVFWKILLNDFFVDYWLHDSFSRARALLLFLHFIWLF